jgi:hypothetical protein
MLIIQILYKGILKSCGTVHNDTSTPRKSNDLQCTFDITCGTVHNDTSTPRKSNDLQCTFNITCDNIRFSNNAYNSNIIQRYTKIEHIVSSIPDLD